MSILPQVQPTVVSRPDFLASAESGECNNNMHGSLTQQYAKTRNGKKEGTKYVDKNVTSNEDTLV